VNALCRVLGHKWALHHLVTIEEYPMHHGCAVYECSRCHETKVTS
jgi:hypothetical protein